MNSMPSAPSDAASSSDVPKVKILILDVDMVFWNSDHLKEKDQCSKRRLPSFRRSRLPDSVLRVASRYSHSRKVAITLHENFFLIGS